MKNLILILFLFCSCVSVRDEDTNKSDDTEPRKYEKTDVGDVEDALKTIDGNKELMKVNIQKGRDRAEMFEPLFLKLLNSYQFGYSLTKEDLKPFVPYFNKISSMYVEEELQTFVRLGTQNAEAIKSMKQELEKAINNNEANDADKKKIKELEDTIKSGVIEKAMWISGIFFLGGGILNVLGVFYPIAGMKKAGVTLICIGGFVLMFGVLTDFTRNFLDEWGSLVVGVPLGTFLAFKLYFFFRKEKIDIDEYEEDANDDEA